MVAGRKALPCRLCIVDFTVKVVFNVIDGVLYAGDPIQVFPSCQEYDNRKE